MTKGHPTVSDESWIDIRIHTDSISIVIDISISIGTGTGFDRSDNRGCEGVRSGEAGIVKRGGGLGRLHRERVGVPVSKAWLRQGGVGVEGCLILVL